MAYFRGTHSIEMVILYWRQNQKEYLTKILRKNLGLPRLMILRRFIVSIWSTPILPLHCSSRDWMHRVTPINSRWAEDWIDSYSKNYSRAINVTPLKVCPPHPKSLSWVATCIERPEGEGQMSESNLMRGRSFQNSSSFNVASETVRRAL